MDITIDAVKKWAESRKTAAQKIINIKKEFIPIELLYLDLQALTARYVVEMMNTVLTRLKEDTWDNEAAANYMVHLQSALIYQQINFTGTGNLDAADAFKESAQAAARKSLLMDFDGPLAFTMIM